MNILNIHYPNIMTNNDIYAMTRQHLWTDKINQNNLRFTGHILRLPEGTPARQALQIALIPATRPRGRQKTTWIQSTHTLLQSVGLDQGCPTRGPRAAMWPAWCLCAAHYSFSLQVVFLSKIVTISSKRVERA